MLQPIYSYFCPYVISVIVRLLINCMYTLQNFMSHTSNSYDSIYELQ